ncbi:MAG TPA: hypothetical protein VGS19_29070 [Streptosporangiaceae bacterium]|nr:hypothetical protein [Streptosporangiaceae bacterium]
MSEYTVQVRKATPTGLLSGPALTYRYGSPLEAGDRVLCPATEFMGPFLAEVVALGSDYRGYTKSLICRVAPDRPEPA